ncbi:MAG: rhodanese-like domain-containing protein, partial [Anaeromyxobacteraceae bacterium]
MTHLTGVAATFVAALAFATAAAAPAPDAAKQVAATGIAPGYVDVPSADKLMAAGVTVLDVRTAEEFGAGHLPGALNIPFDEVAKRHAEVGPPTTPVLVYCKSGRRSAVAAQELRKAGFGAIYDMKAYDAWAAAHGKK